MPSWLNGSFALGFFVGLMVAIVVYTIDWFWHVKIRPRADERARLKGEKPKKDNSLTGRLYEEDRERHPEEYETAPPSRSLNPPPTTARPTTPRPTKEPGPRTSDMPATQEHRPPEPKTSFIDWTQAPPPLAGREYGGFERRRADTPSTYTGPERRHAAPGGARMTRAEDRRIREGEQNSPTESEQPPTDEG